MVLMAALCVLVPGAVAQEEEGHGEEASSRLDGVGTLGIAIGAGLAVGLAGIGTGLAQASVGAGGTGAMAERPELFTNVLILFAIPETIVLFGFVIAIILSGSIG
jgi:V/A-type H+-transporting ATPase subunit K